MVFINLQKKGQQGVIFGRGVPLRGEARASPRKAFATRSLDNVRRSPKMPGSTRWCSNNARPIWTRFHTWTPFTGGLEDIFVPKPETLEDWFFFAFFDFCSLIKILAFSGGIEEKGPLVRAVTHNWLARCQGGFCPSKVDHWACWWLAIQNGLQTCDFPETYTSMHHRWTSVWRVFFTCLEHSPCRRPWRCKRWGTTSQRLPWRNTQQPCRLRWRSASQFGWNANSLVSTLVRPVSSQESPWNWLSLSGWTTVGSTRSGLTPEDVGFWCFCELDADRCAKIARYRKKKPYLAKIPILTNIFQMA